MHQVELKISGCSLVCFSTTTEDALILLEGAIKVGQRALRKRQEGGIISRKGRTKEVHKLQKLPFARTRSLKIFKFSKLERKTNKRTNSASTTRHSKATPTEGDAELAYALRVKVEQQAEENSANLCLLSTSCPGAPTWEKVSFDQQAITFSPSTEEARIKSFRGEIHSDSGCSQTEGAA